MSQDIFILMGNVVSPSQFQQATQEMTFLDSTIIVGDRSIESGEACIWPNLESNSADVMYHPEDPEEAHLLFYPNGYSLDPTNVSVVESALRREPQSIIGITIASNPGSQRLAIMLATMLISYGPLLVDMNWDIDTKVFFSAEEIQALFASGDPNPIYEAYRAYNIVHAS